MRKVSLFPANRTRRAGLFLRLCCIAASMEVRSKTGFALIIFYIAVVILLTTCRNATPKQPTVKSPFKSPQGIGVASPPGTWQQKGALQD